MRLLLYYHEVWGIMDYPTDEPAGETSGDAGYEFIYILYVRHVCAAGDRRA